MKRKRKEMGYIWLKTKTSGVRYREHSTRKHGVKFDRYFTIRYRLEGKDKEEALGWASQGWTEKKASARLSELKEAHRTGVGEKTLSEKRKTAIEKEKTAKKLKEIESKENITFDSVFNEYIKQAYLDKRQKTCVEEVAQYKNWISPMFSEKPLKDISPFLLEKLKKTMADKDKAPRTVTYVLATIRQVFNYAKINDLYYGDNPVSKVKKPREDNRRVRFLSYEEADLLLDALGKASKSLHDMAKLSLRCGLRAGEVFNLEWSDIDFKNETILIKDTKNGRNRNAIMTKDVKEMLGNMKNNLKSNILFPSRKGEKITEVSRTFDRVVDSLGFNKGITDRRKKVVFHSLRHTYASWLVMSGVDLYTVQKLMGHSSISMTERYSHLAPDHLKKAVSMMEQSLNSNVVNFNELKKGA